MGIDIGADQISVSHALEMSYDRDHQFSSFFFLQCLANSPF